MAPQHGKLRHLFERIVKGQASTKEKERFTGWYEQLDLSGGKIFDNQEEEDLLNQRLHANLHQHAFGTQEAGAGYLWPNWRRYAAAILLLLGFFALFRYYAPTKAPTSYAVAADTAIKKVRLPDGTNVTLNLGSTLTWDDSFNEKTRGVTITGEGYFEVKPDKGKPFLVRAGQLEAKVLGTAFNVESYAGEPQVKVSLIRGAVQVQDKSNPGEAVRLKPGEMADYHIHTARLEVKPTPVDQPYAWTTGGLVFNELPLATALDRLAKKHGLALRYDQAQVKNKTVTANLGQVSWKEALQAILFMHDLNYTQNKKGEISIE